MGLPLLDCPRGILTAGRGECEAPAETVVREQRSERRAIANRSMGNFN